MFGYNFFDFLEIRRVATQLDDAPAIASTPFQVFDSGFLPRPIQFSIPPGSMKWTCSSAGHRKSSLCGSNTCPNRLQDIQVFRMRGSPQKGLSSAVGGTSCYVHHGS